MNQERDYQKEIETIIEFFQNNKIKIVKLNHSLNTSGSTYYDSFIQLSKDGNQFEITNKVPRQNSYTLATD